MSHQFASPESYGLRWIKDSDAEKFQNWEEAERPYPWTKDHFLKIPRPFHTRTLVWEDEGAIWGYAAVQIVVDEGYLINFMVHKDFRGTGKGVDFMEKILAWTHRSGANEMYLDVDVLNTSALRLYEKIGFRAVQIREKGYPRGENALVMKKDLVDIYEPTKNTKTSPRPKRQFET